MITSLLSLVEDEVNELKQTIESKDRLIEELTRQIDEYELELHKLQQKLL